jgi:hypothetical protein
VDLFSETLTVFSVYVPIPQWEWAASAWTAMALVCVIAWLLLVVDFRRAQRTETDRIESAVARITRNGLLF